MALLCTGQAAAFRGCLAALIPFRSGLRPSPRSCAKTALLLTTGRNPVCMSVHGFALLELGDLMASVNYKISEDRATKSLSQIIGLNNTTGQKCCLNQMNFSRKL